MKNIFIVGFTLIAQSSALMCWTCDNARSTEQCIARGRLNRCQLNEKACFNEVRMDNDGIRIAKRCKQSLACHNNFIQNPRPAYPAFQCDPKVKGSVCRCCCEHDGCNIGDISCVDSAPLCPTLLNPRNGRTTCVFADSSNEIGSICTFTCNRGFELIGNEASECVVREISPQFTNPVPTCRELRCRALGNPINGQTNCVFQGSATEIGSICTFTCGPGFELNGDGTSVCVLNRRFPRFTNPVPTCRAVDCRPPQSDPTNGQVMCSDTNNIGSVCDFNCSGIFFLNGPPNIVCLETGRWSALPPRCVRLICIPPQIAPSNGQVSCSDQNNEDSICTFTCSAGYLLEGNPETVCQDDGDNDTRGLWSAVAPTCRAIVCLPEYTSFNNGVVDCTNSNVVSSECTFSCTDRYFLSGPEVLTCFQIDEFGVWDNPPPVCQLKRCGNPPPPPPENGFVVCTGGDILDAQCEYGCEGLRTRVGELYSTCVELEDGSLVWDNPSRVCERTQCPAQGPLGFGQFFCSDGSFAESECFFECLEPGFVLFPTAIDTNRCFNDTTWSVPEPCCTRPCPPYARFDAVFILDSSSSVGIDNWGRMTGFTRSLLESFNLGDDLARLAVFRYNSEIDTETQILLNAFPGSNDREALVAAFDNIEYDGAGTRTGQALRHVLEVILAPENGNRPDVDDVVFLITDGLSQDDVSDASQELRDAGVILFALGIFPPDNEIDLSSLVEIVGQENLGNLVEVEGFEGLDAAFLNIISAQICGNPCDENL